MSVTRGRFAVRVAKEYLAFAAAHFISYSGFRERLHGHNYAVAVSVEGDLGPDGYVIDFGLVKKIARGLCDELDERLLIPRRSNTMEIEERDDTVKLTCEDGARFIVPLGDVVLLPITHTSAEELSRYLCERLAEELRVSAAEAISTVEVSVAEAPGQAASYRRST